MHNVVYRADYGRCCRTVLVAVGMTLRFFCYLFERRSSGFTHGKKSIGKKKGLAIVLTRATIASPHYHEEVSSWRL
jgi:hypothetical protein